MPGEDILWMLIRISNMTQQEINNKFYLFCVLALSLVNLKHIYSWMFTDLPTIYCHILRSSLDVWEFGYGAKPIGYPHQRRLATNDMYIFDDNP